MRSIDPATGKPFPRKRPVRWGSVRNILAYRRERHKMKLAGYIERELLQGSYGPHMGKRIVAAVPSADGQSVFVRVVDKDGKPATLGQMPSPQASGYARYGMVPPSTHAGNLIDQMSVLDRIRLGLVI